MDKVSEEDSEILKGKDWTCVYGWSSIRVREGFI